VASVPSSIESRALKLECPHDLSAETCSCSLISDTAARARIVRAMHCHLPHTHAHGYPRGARCTSWAQSPTPAPIGPMMQGVSRDLTHDTKQCVFILFR
jgi:hypothetical protein